MVELLILNGSYIGYVLTGTSASNRINENRVPYMTHINGSGNFPTANHALNKQQYITSMGSRHCLY